MGGGKIKRPLQSCNMVEMTASFSSGLKEHVE